jgi:DNA modification methylase
MTPLKFMAAHIQLWAVDRLIPYARNARTHSEQQVAQVAASIVEFGFTNPILVDSQAGIIAGHCRLLAARKLGLAEVPVVVLDHLTETQKRAYILADNQLALIAGWDEEVLGNELASLAEDHFDPALAGFDEQEVAALLANLESEFGDHGQDQTPPVPETPVSVPGDIWVLGRHRLMTGNALSASCLEQLMQGQSATMVFTDPPYNVNYSGGAGAATSRPITNDNLGAAFGPFIEQACRNILAVTTGGVYLCTSSSELHTVQKAFVAAGGHWSTFLVWAKNTFTLGRSDYQRQYEPILYGWREGGQRYWCGDRDQGDVWFVDKPAVNDLHPTMKPVELVERAVGNSSRSGDIVLDPFGGSGSTMLACEKLGRRARLIELEPQYVDVAVRRWQQFTGRQATLEADGRTFEEVATARLGALPCTPA